MLAFIYIFILECFYLIIIKKPNYTYIYKQNSFIFSIFF